VVCIEGQYRFVDSTWGTGVIENRVFRRRFSPFWFLTLPIDFVETHLPKNSVDQHLKPQLTMQAFLRRPFATPVFFEHRLKLLPPSDTDVIQGDNDIVIEVILPDTAFFGHCQVCLILAFV